MNPIVLVAGPSIADGLEIQGSLDGLDCEVRVAQTAREVVRFATNHGVDLLILDTALSDMEGHKLIPILREVTPNLPIIVTTGSNSPALEREVRRSAIIFYAIRPDDLHHLEGVVRKNLGGETRRPKAAGG